MSVEVGARKLVQDRDKTKDASSRRDFVGSPDATTTSESVGEEQQLTKRTQSDLDLRLSRATKREGAHPTQNV